MARFPMPGATAGCVCELRFRAPMYQPMRFHLAVRSVIRIRTRNTDQNPVVHCFLLRLTVLRFLSNRYCWILPVPMLSFRQHRATWAWSNLCHEGGIRKAESSVEERNARSGLESSEKIA